MLLENTNKGSQRRETKRSVSMEKKQIIPYINTENEWKSSVVQRAISYESNGADAVFLYNHDKSEKEKEEFFTLVREVVRKIDIPVYAGCFVERFEDIKKTFYTGAAKVILPFRDFSNHVLIKQATERFGKEQIIIEFDETAGKSDGYLEENSELPQEMVRQNVGGILLKHIKMSEVIKQRIEASPLPVYIRDSLIRNDMETLISMQNVLGVATNYYENKDIMKIKGSLQEASIPINLFEASLVFDELKKNEAGLVPVIVQDYRSAEVLMLAYMDEKAYNQTVQTGKMTYYSRSRKGLWVKGETSGHFQFVKSLELDCDRDTILAKVKQIGVACHTGNPTCFFTNLVNKGIPEKNPMRILDTIFSTILDRKQVPKEGSYTNYLFDKGLDKILKKCGEEATEIVIAAKNQESEELKYEIADFLYHLMVLMVEKDLSFEDITRELANRH